MSEYESLVVVSVAATNVSDVADTLERERWLNYKNDYGKFEGKIVPLFPEHEKSAAIGYSLMAALPFPDKAGASIDYSTLSFMTFLKLQLEASSHDEAEAFLKSCRWFNKTRYITLQSYSCAYVPNGLDTRLV